MRLTRRGYGVLAVALLAVALAAHSGARTLNAVAGPAFVVIAFGALALARTDAPTVSRRTTTAGFPGETRTVVLHVDADGPCEVTDRTADGLQPTGQSARSVDGDGVTRRIAGGGSGPRDVAYDVELLERGDQHLGPTRVVQRDALGVVSRETVVGRTDTVLVYPRVEPIAPNRALQGLVEQTGSPDREAFDTLREYVPGDALRDVHWASSAKRQPDELVVATFAREDEGGVTIVAEGDSGHGDEMAAAAASVAVHLLEIDVQVELYAPGGHVRRGRGDRHRDELLELLARTPAGRVGGSVEADVRVRADDAGIRVTVDDASFPFADLQGGTRTAAGRTADHGDGPDDERGEEVVA